MIHKFTDEDYLNIHNLVYEYKDGSEEAAEKLIDSFNNFFINYTKLIKFGKFSICNYSTTSFIKLFIENSYERKIINPYFYMKKGTGRETIGSTINKIMLLFESSTFEDVMQDLRTIFLIMCTKYKDINPTFHAFINRNFHFYAFRYWKKNIVDPLSRGNFVSIYNSVTDQCDDFRSYYQDICYANALIDYKEDKDKEKLINNINAHYIKKQSNIPTIETNNNDIYNNNYINTNWINGATCENEIFKILTPLERKLIKYWYIDNYTDTEIGKMLGISRCVINRKRNAAKRKLFDYRKNNPAEEN